MFEKVPVLLLAFNRADHARESLSAIRKYQPQRIYLECDGPRLNKIGEASAVEETRQTMLSMVDWPCEVKTLFREKNLGCANAVYDAVSWFFDNEEWGVIIEDDVIVSQDFFKLCEILLPKYKDSDKILHINAQYYGPTVNETNEITFGVNMYCWGWASWARAWRKMDMQLSGWPSFNKKIMFKHYGYFRALFYMYYWNRAYKTIQQGTNSSWATRWNFAILYNEGICISPKVNLSKNIGTSGGTHYTKYDKDPYEHLQIGNLLYPLSFPASIVYDQKQLKIDRKEFKRLRFIGLKKKIYIIFTKAKNVLNKPNNKVV